MGVSSFSFYLNECGAQKRHTKNVIIRENKKLFFVFEVRNNFANNSASESQNANYKNKAGRNGAPRTDIG